MMLVGPAFTPSLLMVLFSRRIQGPQAENKSDFNTTRNRSTDDVERFLSFE